MLEYNFAQTNLIINGVHITGFGEGDEVIQIRRRNNQSEDMMSADGEMIVFDTYDLSGEVRFTLNPMSGANGFMHSLITLSNVVGVRTPILIQFTDLNGLDIISATTGYIPKPADIRRGLNSGSQTWNVIVERLLITNLNLDFNN